MKSAGKGGPGCLEPIVILPLLFSILLSLGQALILTSNEPPGSSSRQEEARRMRRGLRTDDSCLSSFKDVSLKFHPVALLIPPWFPLTAGTHSLSSGHPAFSDNGPPTHKR